MVSQPSSPAELHLQVEQKSRTDLLNKLPLEVITEVFSWYLPQTPDVEKFYEDQYWDVKSEDGDTSLTSVVYPQRILGLVNRAWRELVLSTPSFWTFCSFAIPWDFQSPRVALIREWLQRSKSLPLAIRISMQAAIVRGSEPSEDTMKSLIEALNTSTHRWSSVFLRVPEDFISSLSCSSLDGPPLKALYIDIKERTSLPRPQIYTGSKHDATFQLQGTPSPSHLHMCSFYLDNLHVSFRNLVRLHADSISIDECMLILKEASRLLDCELDISLDIPPSVIGPPVTLSSIYRLDLQGEIGPLVQQITCPALRHLTWDPDSAIYAEWATSFILRSNCPLQTLGTTSYYRTLNDADFLSFLRLIPSLTELSLCQPIGGLFLRELRETMYVGQEDPNCLLPNLDTFIYTGPKNFSWEELVGIIPPSAHSGINKPCRFLSNAQFDFSWESRQHWDSREVDETIYRLDPLAQATLEKLLESSRIPSIKCRFSDDVINFWKKEYGLMDQGKDDQRYATSR